MNANETNTVALHPWEVAGLGKPPYKFVGIEHKIGPIRPIDPKTGQWDGMTEYGAPGQPMGSCQACGQGIAWCCWILSSDGKRFYVGSDCVEKVEREPRILKQARKIITEGQKARKIETTRAKTLAKFPDLPELLLPNVVDRFEAQVTADMARRFDASGKLSDKQVEWLRRMERRTV